MSLKKGQNEFFIKLRSCIDSNVRSISLLFLSIDVGLTCCFQLKINDKWLGSPYRDNLNN